MKKSLGADTLIYPTPAWVVGTYDKEGKPNLMTIAWGGICCSQPPCLAISLRKATYSYGNVSRTEGFYGLGAFRRAGQSGRLLRTGFRPRGR